MRVTFLNKLYELRFLYPQGESDLGSPRRTVRCDVLEKQPDGEWRLVADGEAICHPIDRFTKEQGRLIALRRALDPRWCRLPRPLRKALHCAYQNRDVLRAPLEIL